MSGPKVETLTARRCVGVQTELRQQEIGDRIGELLPGVMAAAGDAVAGAPFARWHGWDDVTGVGRMELGVPVSRPVAPAGDARAGELPGGRAVVHWHIGPYADLMHSWKLVREWVAEKGLVSRGAPWEEYCGDCSVTPPAQLRTRIVWPVE